MEWSMPQYMGPPPPARDAHTAVVVVDNLFVFGGRNNETIFNDLFLLNLSSFFIYLIFFNINNYNELKY